MSDLEEGQNCPECGTEIINAPAIGLFCQTKGCQMGLPKNTFRFHVEHKRAIEIIQSLIDTHRRDTEEGKDEPCDFVFAWESAIRQLAKDETYK